MDSLVALEAARRRNEATMTELNRQRSLLGNKSSLDGGMQAASKARRRNDAARAKLDEKIRTVRDMQRQDSATTQRYATSRTLRCATSRTLRCASLRYVTLRHATSHTLRFATLRYYILLLHTTHYSLCTTQRLHTELHEHKEQRAAKMADWLERGANGTERFDYWDKPRGDAN